MAATLFTPQRRRRIASVAARAGIKGLFQLAALEAAITAAPVEREEHRPQRVLTPPTPVSTRAAGLVVVVVRPQTAASAPQAEVLRTSPVVQAA